MNRRQSTLTLGVPVQACDLCGRDYQATQPGQPRGICLRCSAHLGGGKYSARIVQAEAKSIQSRAAARGRS